MSTISNTTRANERALPNADPDVAGPGVLIGFILTGFLTLVASELTMWLRQLDDHEYMEQLQVPAEGFVKAARSARRRLLSLVKLVAVRLAPKNTTNAPRFWASTLARLTLNLADQQLVTGLLILVSALIRYVPTFDLASLAIASDAAIFASVTHLASLRTLRIYLREHFRMTVCRLTIVGLTSALIIAIYAYQVARQNDSSSNAIQIGLLIWLSWSVALSVFVSDLALSARSAFDSGINTGKVDSPYIVLWMQSVNIRDTNGSPSKTKNPITAVSLRLCKWYITAGVTRSWYVCELAELFFLWYFLSLVLWLQFSLSVKTLVDDIRASDTIGTWGFGQLLPTFLILLPSFALIETYGNEARVQSEGALHSELPIANLATPCST